MRHGCGSLTLSPMRHGCVANLFFPPPSLLSAIGNGNPWIGVVGDMRIKGCEVGGEGVKVPLYNVMRLRLGLMDLHRADAVAKPQPFFPEMGGLHFLSRRVPTHPSIPPLSCAGSGFLFHAKK